MRTEKDFIISSRRTIQIINYLYINPKSSSSKIIRELNLSTAVVSITMGRLKRWNLIIRDDDGKKSRKIPYSLNQEGMEIGKLINELMFKLK